MRVVNVSSNGFALVSQSLYLIIKYDKYFADRSIFKIYLDIDIHIYITILMIMIYHININI